MLCLIPLVGQVRAGETVQSLRYGATLFHFYQQDYFGALTELMTAQQLQLLGVHANNAELLRGGISLSYGMDGVAEQIFSDLLSEAGGNVDRDQAWFYLAKMTWQRGQLQRAGLALEQISADYQGPVSQEADYLRAAVSLRQGDQQRAAGLLEQLPEDSPWRGYLHYNLGAAQAARGDWLDAVDNFSWFDRLRARNPESKALRDKALTASGFALMAAGHFEQAGEEFAGVRLDSPMSDRALLGYGWASSERGDYLAALRPWQALSERSLLSDSVRESLLAIPYAYENLGKQGVALSSYQQAAEQYSDELRRVEAAIAAFRRGDLSLLLGLAGDEEGQDWLFGGDILPVGEHAPYLQHLITRHSFQLAMRELRDLYSMAWHLERARERLQVLQQVDADQQRSWATVMNGDRRELLLQRQQDLAARADALRRKVETARANGDARLLADAEQAARWQRLDRAMELAGDLDNPPEQTSRLALYRGLMIWEDSENFPARSWQLQRELTELAGLAQDTRARLQSVDEAISHRSQTDFSSRIAMLEERVRIEGGRVQLAINGSQVHIRQVAIEALELQASQLVAALGRSRLAVARLYDLGSPEVPR